MTTQGTASAPVVAERPTARLIREAAAELFFERGYEATTLRQVAAAVGLRVGSLYNHIDSKEHLLLMVMGAIMDDLLVEQARALESGGDVIDRLISALDCHLRFHASRARDVFIGNSELRSLPETQRTLIIDKRRQYEEVIRDLIVEAGDRGMAHVLDAHIHTFSIVAQASHVAGWYKPDGRLTLDDIVRIYAKIVLRELGVADADQRVDQHR